ncbi:adenylate kinase family protein [Candidatus Anaplasma sp. TIGMIC]|uniref:adenylate kinase family protein n=1 Tax=Candidatus Anaplasma sp. TIGMIC TaxID=3020713 RepID=UPI00232BEB0F|nr:nucleoside monophosphate kinase [Candidatus Anaplasma sp. TIGMIC]MDB1135240.1 nucleoside monophosphate kinase [Candidatus Anaplasma sp. TIGMIC]
MEEDQVNLLIFGAPGSGKGTQARLLSEYLPSLKVISMGDLLRSEVDSGTEVGKEAKKAMLDGALVSDLTVCQMILGRLAKVRSGFLLDGFPRNLRQAEFLTAAMRLLDGDIDIVFKLEVAADVVESRLCGRLVCSNCGAVTNMELAAGACEVCGYDGYRRRDDDSVDVVRRRLVEYEREIVALEEYYQGKVVRINGNRTVDEVYEDVKRRVDCLNN